MREKLGEILVQLGQVARADVEAAVQDQRVRGGTPRLGELLVERGRCDEEAVAKGVAVQAGLKYCQISKFLIPAQVIARVPRDVAAHAGVFPLKVGQLALVVAVESPLDLEALDDLRFLVGMEVEQVIASAVEIELALDTYYPHAPAAAPLSLDELKVASGSGLLGRALSTFEGELQLELDEDRLLLRGACRGMRVQHALRLEPPLQQRLLAGLRLDPATLASAQVASQRIVCWAEDQPHDLLVSASARPGGRSLRIRRLAAP